MPDEIAFLGRRLPNVFLDKAWDFPRASLGTSLGVALGGIGRGTRDMHLLADLMPNATRFARLETGFPGVDRHFRKMCFEKPSFQGVDFCDVLGCSLGFGWCSSIEAAILGFFQNEQRTTMQILGCTLGKCRISTRENKVHDFKFSIKRDIW